MSIEIIEYRPQYATEFKTFNVAWISSYFDIEEHDLEQLDHPEEIINGGGAIFFARDRDDILGTVALLKTGSHEFELVKMAVNAAAQGKGIGKLLCRYSLDFARKNEAKRVWLESNRILKTALHIYYLAGFVEVPIDSSPYSRADIRMEVLLEA